MNTIRTVLCALPLLLSLSSRADSPAGVPDWRDYVAGPRARIVTPDSVEWFGGNVTFAEGALVQDGVSAVLSRSGGTTPLLALDFGLPVSGKVEVVFGGTADTSLNLAFSQRLEYLAIGSDTDSFCLGDLSVAARPGVVWRADARRTFRYLLLYLPSAGTVQVDAVRCYHTPFLGRPETYDGHFVSNDDTLNRIWYGCVYTQEICTTSGLGCDGDWETEEGWLSVSHQGDGEFGLCVPGEDWTAYSFSFDFVIMPMGGACGWLFRAADESNLYLWQIVGEHGATPNTLRKHVRQNGNWTSITSANLPEAIHEGEPHHVRTEIVGSTIRTYLDGRLVDTTNDGTFSRGRIGFRASYRSEHFHVDNVTVATDFQTLLFDSFEGDTLEADGTKWERAELLTINDGAKRDRVWVWGDFYPAQRAMYAAHWLPQVVAGTLRDGAEHQYTAADEARWGGILSGKIPAANGGNYMSNSAFDINWLDDYTLWWVLTLHHHWMRTGDAAFAAELYPALQRVFGWCLRKHSGRGLINLRLGDWYWSFLREGEATAFNVLYVEALRRGAEIAAALGQTTDAATWRARADGVAAAINTHLFDAGQGLYVDRTADRGHYPLDANALAVLTGIAPPERVEGILSKIQEHMWSPLGTRSAWPPYDTWGHNQQVWAWYVQYEAAARFAMRDDARALETIRRPWGHMERSDPGRTMWEFMMGDGTLENGLRNTDHAFSAGAAWLLSEYVAGIRPTAPGFAAVDIIPHPADLVSVSCAVPSPLGPVSIAYEVDPQAKTFRARVTVPAGATARVGVPRLDDSAMVTQNGTIVWSPAGPVGGATADAAYLYFPQVGPGTHEFDAAFGPVRAFLTLY